MQENQNNKENKHNIELISSKTLIKILQEILIEFAQTTRRKSLKKIENADFEEFLAKLEDMRKKISKPGSGGVYNNDYKLKSSALKTTTKRLKGNYNLYMKLDKCKFWPQIEDCFVAKPERTLLILSLLGKLSLICYNIMKLIVDLLYLIALDIIIPASIIVIIFMISFIPIVILSTVAPEAGAVIGLLCLIGQGCFIYKPIKYLGDKLENMTEDLTNFLKYLIVTKDARKYLEAQDFLAIYKDNLKPNETKFLEEIKAWQSLYFNCTKLEELSSQIFSKIQLYKRQQLEYDTFASTLPLDQALNKRLSYLSTIEAQRKEQALQLEELVL